MKDLSIDQLCVIGKTNPEIPDKFLYWLRDNKHVWDGFQREAFKVIRSGRKHYSAYTIREYLRHETMLREVSDEVYKISNNHTPSLARLFATVYPEHANLLSFKTLKVGQEAA